MNIIIRTDGGKGVGMGHIMRTLVLANKLKEFHNVTYVCKDHTNFLSGVSKIESEGFEVIKIDNEESITNLKADFLIIDKYDVSTEYLNKLRESFKILYIDDNNSLDFYPVDIILNQNPHGMTLKYKTFQDTKLLCGGKYTLIRDEFLNKNPIRINKSIVNILITVGGSDDYNFTGSILDEIRFINNININVVIGNAFKYKDSLKGAYNMYLHIKFYENPNMSEVMSKSDLCISACGSTLYELSYLGVPTLGIVIAENQKICAEFMKNERCIELCDTNTILEKINNLTYNKRIELHKNMIKLINGNGVKKILEVIDNFI